MADWRLVLVQARAQLTSISRNRRAVVISLVIPVVILVMFNSIFGGGDDTVDLAGARITASAYFAGAMVAYALIGIAFMQVAITLVSQRETGQLKRYRGTPVPAWTFIVATVLRVAAMAVSVTAILLLIARLAYGVEVSAEALAEIVAYIALGTATLCSAGIAATTVVPDVESASAALPRRSSSRSTSCPPGWRMSGASSRCTTWPSASRRRWASPATRRCAGVTLRFSRRGRWAP
jgi:ABC-2 type transport system permease protein